MNSIVIFSANLLQLTISNVYKSGSHNCSVKYLKIFSPNIDSKISKIQIFIVVCYYQKSFSYLYFFCFKTESEGYILIKSLLRIFDLIIGKTIKSHNLMDSRTLKDRVSLIHKIF